MTKKTISITIDDENAEWARKNLNNISSSINEFLDNCRAKYNEDIDGINIKLEKIYLKKAENKLNYWTSELQLRQQKIQKYEEKQAEKEKIRLEKEKEDIEKAESCINCSTKVTPKWHEFSIGNVCNACFLNSNAKDFERWGGK